MVDTNGITLNVQIGLPGKQLFAVLLGLFCLSLRSRYRRAANDSAVEGPCVPDSAEKVSGNSDPL